MQKQLPTQHRKHTRKIHVFKGIFCSSFLFFLSFTLPFLSIVYFHIICSHVTHFSTSHNTNISLYFIRTYFFASTSLVCASVFTTHSTSIHAPGGIRTLNPSKRPLTDHRLRSLGYWDSNPQSQQARGYGPTPQTALPSETQDSNSRSQDSRGCRFRLWSLWPFV